MHEWETEWEGRESLLADAPGNAASELDDLVTHAGGATPMSRKHAESVTRPKRPQRATVTVRLRRPCAGFVSTLRQRVVP
jgi:hypothetical protein